MTNPSDTKRAARAYAALEKHRPVRTQWAQRLASQGKLFPLLLIRSILLLILPFVWMGAAGLMWYSGAEPDTPLFGMPRWGWAVAMVLTHLFFLVVVSQVISAVLKRSSAVSVFGQLPLLEYVPGCPRLSQAVRKWALESGDAALSVYEYKLIDEVIWATGLNRVVALNRAVSLLEMDESFYEVFPFAPRFSGDQSGSFSDASNYIKHVESLDGVVGHLDAARARHRAAELEKVMVGSSCSVKTNRTRL